MDDFKILFDKIKNRDKASFQILTETYGWKLYSYIRKNVESRELADEIFSETLSRFHNNAEKYDTQDPIEAMLCLYADEIGKEHITRPAAVPQQLQNVPSPNFEAVPVPVKKKKCSVLAGIFYALCILLLLAAIAAALWFLIGMLVDMEILPAAWDFGYSWFNENIANLF